MNKGSLKNFLRFRYLIIISIPLLILSILIIGIISDQIGKKIESQNQQYINSISEKIDIYVNQPTFILANLRKIVERKFIEGDKLNHYLNDITNNFPLFENVQVVDSEGIILNSAKAPNQFVGLDLRNEIFFNNTITGNKPYFSSSFISIYSGKSTITISVKTNNSRFILGYLNLDFLNREIKKTSLGKNSFAAIIDSKGTYIAHTDTTKVNERVTDQYYNEIISDTFTNNKEFTYNDLKVRITKKYSNVGNWNIIIAVDPNEEYSVIRKIFIVLLSGLLVSIVLTIWTSINSISSIIKPLKKLREKADSLSEGNYDEKIYIENTYDEFLDIINTVNLMSNNIKKRENELKDARNQLLEAGHAAHIGSWIYNFEEQSIYWSEETYNIFEHDKDKPLDFNIMYKQIYKDDVEKFDSILDDFFKEEKSLTFEIRIIVNNKLKHIYHSAKSIFKNGKPFKLSGIMWDITKMKEADKEIILKNNALQHSINGFCVLGMNWEMKYVNNAFLKMWGYSQIEEVLNKELKTFFNNQSEYNNTVKEFNSKNLLFSEITGKKKNGPIFYALMALNKYDDKESKTSYIFASFIDITDKKIIELKLRQQQKEERELLDGIPALIFLKNVQGKDLWFNKEMASLFNIPQIPVTTESLYNEEMTAKFKEEDDYVLKNCKPLRNLIDKFNLNGKELYFKTDKIPLFDENHQLRGLVGFAFEITDLKKAEESILKLNAELENRVEERTKDLQKVNNELESFSYSVSHDLRAPLRAISGFSSIILEEYENKLDEEAKELLQDILKNTKKMNNLIDDLLKFSRLGKKELVKIDLNINTMVEEIINDFSFLDERKITFIKSILPNSSGDYTLIKQVFTNLISNAVKYTRGKEKVEIKISGEIKNNFVIYSVEDNGVGFDMQYSDKLFKVFQRLHSEKEFEGTGVGLAIVNRIITKHGGEAWAEAELNKGAKFYFSLPIS